MKLEMKSLSTKRVFINLTLFLKKLAECLQLEISHKNLRLFNAQVGGGRKRYGC
jgi:hypothetical protein